MKKTFVLGIAVLFGILMAGSAFAAIGFLPEGTTQKFLAGEDSHLAAVRGRTGWLPSGVHIGGDRSDVIPYDSLKNYYYRYNGRFFSNRGWFANFLGIWPRTALADRELHHKGKETTLYWCKGDCAYEAEEEIAQPTRAQSGMLKLDNTYVWN